MLGSLWACSEIVLGGFLHSARVPFRGDILTGIGIAILVAGRGLWPERGLLWRSGLVCAMMKLLSPGASILGPMIAIFMEGILLEAGILAAGANTLGCLLGGGLAMSWTFIHKVASILILYGPDSIIIYQNFWEKLGVWIGRPMSSPWMALFWVWILHFSAGSLAAAFGLRTAASQQPLEAAFPRGKARSAASQQPLEAGRCSLGLLGFHFAFLLAAMLSAKRLAPWPLLAATSLYAAFCVRRYPGAMQRLRRPGFWIGLAAACALAAVMVGRAGGILMGWRVATLALTFSAIGSELRNPALRWILRGRTPVFARAMESAFKTLPAIIANLPEGRRIAASPLAGLRQIISQAPHWLEALEEEDRARPNIHLIAGSRGEGKSTLVARIAGELRRKGARVGGIHSPGHWAEGRRDGFDLVNLRTGRSVPLCHRNGPASWPSAGPFYFSPEGLDFGRRALAAAREDDSDVVIIDEVGPLELDGGGWALELEELTRRSRKPMAWVVRESLIEEVSRRWNLDQPRVWRANGANGESIVAELLDALA